MNLYQALDNVPKEIVILKDGKKIGTGSGQIGCADFVGVRIDEGTELAEKLKNLEPFKSLGMKNTYTRFALVSGLFLGFSSQKEFPEAEAILENSYAVDAFNFSYKIVPDHFKEFEGYGSKFQDVSSQVSGEEKMALLNSLRSY